MAMKAYVDLTTSATWVLVYQAPKAEVVNIRLVNRLATVIQAQLAITPSSAVTPANQHWLGAQGDIPENGVLEELAFCLGKDDKVWARTNDINSHVIVWGPN